QTIQNLILKRRPVKGSAGISVARPITGLRLAPIHRVRRGIVAANVSAWLAVRTHMPELSFLKAQHAWYQQAAPRDVTAPVPETSIDPATGELVIAYEGGDTRHPSDRTDVGAADVIDPRSPVEVEAAFQRSMAQALGDAGARQVDEQEGDARII